MRRSGGGEWTDRLPLLLLALGIFVLTLVFFVRVCILVPSDADDWVLMAKTRTGLPEWGAFNPSKVLPETSLHLVTFVAAYLVMPFAGGDYVWSLVVAAAVIVSLFVALYVTTFARLLRHETGTGATATVCISVLFYLAHFVLLSHTQGDTIPYLLGSRDYTGYFHYTIPYLLCATVAMQIALRGPGVSPRAQTKESNLSLPLLILGIYLGMFSNLYLNIVLAAFSGACLVASLAHVGTRSAPRWTIRTFLKANALHFYVLALWVLTLLFELSGQRASGALDGADGEGGSLHVGAVLTDLLSTVRLLDRRLVLLLGVSLVAAVLIVARQRRGRGRHSGHEDGSAARTLFVVAVSFLLTSLFVILLSSVMDPYTQTIPPIRYYASRPDVFVTMAFPCLVLGCLCMGVVARNVRLVTLAMPIVVFVVAVSAVNGIGRYEEPVRGGITAGSTLASARDMVGQIEAADKAGQASVEVHILKFENDYAPNWPLMTGMGDSIAESLYEAGVTSQRMTVTLVPDADVNERLGLPRDIGASANPIG